MSPANPATYCPTCGLEWQVNGCRPGACAIVGPRECPKCGDKASYVDLGDTFAYSCGSCDYNSPEMPWAAPPPTTRASLPEKGKP